MYKNYLIFLKHCLALFLLSSDIRNEESIAIVKKFDDFDVFMIFGSTSLPQPKNVF